MAENDWETFSDDDNTFGLVDHPLKKIAEPQMVTQQGHQFAMLDWDEPAKSESAHLSLKDEKADKSDEKSPQIGAEKTPYEFYEAGVVPPASWETARDRSPREYEYISEEEELAELAAAQGQTQAKHPEITESEPETEEEKP